MNISKKYKISKNDNSAKIKFITYVSNIISFISSVFTIASFYGYANKKENLYIIIGIALFILTIIIFFNRYSISKRILVFILNKTVPNSNIKICDKKVVYTHLDRYSFKFRSSFYIKVTGDNPINCHEESLKWTAGIISNILPLMRGQKIEYINKDSYNFIDKQKFTIKFPNDKKISKNDEPYKTGFKTEKLIDINHTSKPILQVGVYNITTNLTLRVEFNENLNPCELRGIKYAHFIDENSYDTIPLNIEHDVEKGIKFVEFSIKNPIYGGKYSIDWSFPD